MQGGKSPLSAPPPLVKTTLISHCSTLGLLLAKRDQCTSTADAPDYAGLVKEKAYSLALPSDTVLVVVYYLCNALSPFFYHHCKTKACLTVRAKLH